MGNRNGFHTFTGRWFDYESFTADDICLDDIAHHLSMDCRFGGAEREFFSVAEHCLHCASIYGTWQDWTAAVMDDRRLMLLLLLHDAHEAYTKDFPHFLKHAIPAITEMQDRVDAAIWPAFDIEPPTDAEKHVIHTVDKAAMLAEARVLMPSAVYLDLKSQYPATHTDQPPTTIGHPPVSVELLYKSEVLSLL